MKIDVVSIFPDYLAPLELSLPGKARAKGLLDLTVHDLRDWTHDRHRTTDDSPYGGGAGMVMKPEPWGEAFDALVTPATTVVFTTPSGEPFSQAVAAELATREHLVFACGRYEGIDQRVLDDAATRAEVREISLGDYVLNGGEVAALAITEAVVRLIPGFMGNPESLTEESHEDGLLEYPVYTKPAYLARPRRAVGAAVRRPRRDRCLAPRAGRTAHGRAPPGPRSPGPGGQCRGRRGNGPAGRAGRHRRDPDPAVGLLRPVAARAARRARRGRARRHQLRAAGRRAAGRDDPLPAPRRRHRLAPRAADGRPRPAGTWARAATCSRTPRPPRRRR